MQSSYHSSETGQAIIQNLTAGGREELIVTLHPGNDSSVEIQIKEESAGVLVSSAISINQQSLQKMMQWLRAQGVAD